jgi:hypothetical protein
LLFKIADLWYSTAKNRNFAPMRLPATVLNVLFVSLIVASLAGCQAGGNVNVTSVTGMLSWEAPASYTNGTPIGAGDLKGFRIYYRTENEPYIPERSHFIPAPLTSASVQSLGLSPGTYFFVVTAIDASDVESDFSNERSTLII